MAVNKEEMKYVFSGDVSSLSESTTEAISLLEQYGNEIKKIVKQTKEMVQATTQAKTSSATFKVLKDSATTAANAMKKFAGSKMNFEGMKKDVATLAATVIMKVATIKYQFDSLAPKMQSLKSKFAATFPKLSKFVGSAASAFRRVAKGVAEDTSAIIKNTNITKNLNKAKQGLAIAIKKLPTYFGQVVSKVKETISSFKRLNIQNNLLKNSFKILAGYKLGDFFASGVREAIHYTEVQNMFNVVAGKSIDTMRKFVDSAQEMYGLDPTTIMSMTSEFYNLASAVETPAESARILSQGLTKVALDLSSLFDVDIDKVSSNLEAGMQGMTRAVRKYGLDLRMATLEQTALAYGLKLDADTTSEANRQALRYLTIINQAKSSTSDFARTIESPANQLRILKEQFTQLARAIGQFFLPVLQKVLPYINGMVMAIRSLLNLIASLIGIKDITFGGLSDAADDADSLSRGISAIGDAADTAKKKLKDLTAPFDELNVLSNQTSATSSAGGLGDAGVLDPALAKALAETDTSLTQIRMKANDVRDSILAFFGVSKDESGELTFNADQFEENLVNKFPSWTNSIRALFDNWKDIALGFSNVWSAIGASIGSVFDGIVQGFSSMINSLGLDEKVAEFIESLPNKLQRVADWLNDNQEVFVSIGKVISRLAVAFGVLKIAGTISNILKPLISIFAALGSSGLILVGVITAVVAAFTQAWASSEEFRNSISGMVESVITLFTDLWNALKPVFDSLFGALKSIWNETLQPLLSGVIKLIADVISAIQPLISLLIDILAPVIQTVAHIALSIVTEVVNAIGGVINGIISVIDGIVNFIAGVFTGDWKRAWEGIKSIFKGIWNGLVSVLKVPVNLIIGLINGVLKGITTVINYAIKGINKLKLTVPDWIPGIGGKKFGFNITELTAKQIPTLATGGVVDSPTYSLIGEGAYPEAVVPLGNSPQMQELIDKIAEAVDNKPDDNIPILVTMYLDGDVVYRNQQKVSRRRGVNFNLGAFER